MRSVLAASLLVVLVLAASTACQRETETPDATRPDPQVPPPPEARPLGRILEEAVRDTRVTGFNGVSSISSGAHTVWLLNAFERGHGQRGGQFGGKRASLDHAAIRTSAPDWTAMGRTRAWLPPLEHGQLIPLPEGFNGPEHVVRLLGGIADQPQQTTYFYCVAKPRRGRVAEVLGVGVASFGPATEHALERHDVGGDWRFFGRGDPLFGCAVLQADMGVTTGFDYVFGVRGDAATHGVYLARTPHGKTSDRASYRFFAQGDWSDDVKDAAPLFLGAVGGLSVSWNPHLQAFLAVYSRLEGEVLRVVARAARHPTSDWSAETTLLEVRPPAMGDVVSGAREHAHLAEDDGRVIHVSVPMAEGIGPILVRLELP